MRFFSVLVGMVLAVGLYFGVIWLGVHNPRLSHSLSHCDTSISVLAFFAFVFCPAGLFLSSLVTGFLVEPHIEKSFGEFLFSSPGLYFVIIGSFVFILAYNSAGSLLSDIVFWLVWLGIGVVWSLVSCAGVTLGYKLRAKITGDE